MITTQIFEQPHFSYRGRTSGPIVGHARRWAIAGLIATVTFSTAAAATKLQPRFHQTGVVGEHSLSANLGIRRFGDSFAELAW